MPYNIQHSDTTKNSILVTDGDLNQETSLTFIGKNYNQSYSGIIGENFLHLLENFSSPTAPTKPIEGQLWYNSIENNLNTGLKVFDGTNWIPLGAIKKGIGDPPPIAQSLPFKNGDLYVDTTKQQLYIFGESVWTLVGPKYQIGDKTTAEVETIIDALGNDPRAILTLFVKNHRVAIISDREFIPKSVIDGFPLIKQGITLSNTKFQTDLKTNKFWGTSEKADALVVENATVSSINFLRSDVVSTTNQGFNIRNNNGLSIGEDLTLSISLDSVTNAPVIYNNNPGSNINFRLINNNQIRNVMTIDARSNVAQRGSVGINNNAPDLTTSLDVIGDIKTNGSLIITGGNDSNVISPNIPALSITGGANVSKSLKIGTDLSVNGVSVLGNDVTIKGVITLENTDSGSVLLPSNDDNNDIGSDSKRFSTVYATSFKGPLTGTADSAKYLKDGISIDMSSSDISAPAAIIGNSLQDLSKTLVPTLNSSVIFSKPTPRDNGVTVFNSSLSLLNSDLLLVSRKVTTTTNDNRQQLIKLTGEQILGSFSRATVQPGSIILWQNKDTIPSGYIICDGRALPKQEYFDFFNILYFNVTPDPTFSDGGILKFYIPDLRSSVPAVGMNYIIFTGKT
jgi:hypothetical protein